MPRCRSHFNAAMTASPSWCKTRVSAFRRDKLESIFDRFSQVDARRHPSLPGDRHRVGLGARSRAGSRRRGPRGEHWAGLDLHHPAAAWRRGRRDRACGVSLRHHRIWRFLIHRTNGSAATLCCRFRRRSTRLSFWSQRTMPTCATTCTITGAVLPRDPLSGRWRGHRDASPPCTGRGAH